jgi:hypothetical protein
LCLVSKAILDGTLACLFHTADVSFHDWEKVSWVLSHMGASPCLPLFNHVRILRLLQVNSYYTSLTNYPHDHEKGVAIAALTNSTHCRLLSKCANVHTFTLTFHAPYLVIDSGFYDQYRGYPIDDYFNDFDLQVVLAMKRLRKVVIVGQAKYETAVNGIHDLQGVVKLASQLKDALRMQKSAAEVRIRLECMDEVEEHLL